MKEDGVVKEKEDKGYVRGGVEKGTM